MRYVEVAGVRLPVIGLGTWQFGSREWGYGPEYARTEAVAIARRALELGVSLIDTAEVYGFGRSERIVGRALEGARDRAFVATKVLPVVPAPAVVRRRARASARRLGVDRVDLYQLHWPNPVAPSSLPAAALAAVHREGLAHHVGVSNFSADQWRALEAAAGLETLSNQVEYSLVQRGPERAVLPHAEQAGRVVIAYSPLAQGLLSGRYDPDHRPGGFRRARPLFWPENLARARELLGTLREVADGHGATPAQVALAWVVRHPNTVAIPGASSVAQLEANAEAGDLELTDDEADALRSAAERFRPLGAPVAAARAARARLPAGLRPSAG